MSLRIGIDLSPLQHSGGRGIGVYARSLLDALGRIAPEHEYVLFAPAEVEDVPAPPRHERHTIPVVPFGRGSALVSNQLLLPAVLRRVGLDVLHILHVPLNPSQPLAPFKRFSPLVITLHDLTPLHSPVMLKKLRHRLFYRVALRQCRQADALLTDSSWSREDILQAGVGTPERTFVAPLARHAARRETGSTPALPDQPYALNVGSDDWNKNRDGVLQAFRLLAGDVPVQLLLVGGSGRELDELPPHLRARITHYSWLDMAALLEVYRCAAVFVFPSRYEGFGMPILEAMAAGAPVVTSNRGAMKEVAGRAALLVDPDDPEDIAAAMRRILSDRKLAEQMRQKGLDRAAQFTWEDTARATLEAYQFAAARRTN